MGDVNLHAWFGSEELESCPSCGDMARLRLPASGSLLCLSCGAVSATADAPDRDAARDATAPSE
jgi:hypothetical protein